MSTTASAAAGSVIPMSEVITEVYTPWQQLLMYCDGWAKKYEIAVVTFVNKKDSAFKKQWGYCAPYDQVTVNTIRYLHNEVENRIKELNAWTVSETHPELFRDVALVLGCRPYYLRAVLGSLNIGSSKAVELVYEYSSPLPVYDESIFLDEQISQNELLSFLHESESDRDRRLHDIEKNMRTGYYNSRPSAVQIEVQPDVK